MSLLKAVGCVCFQNHLKKIQNENNENITTLLPDENTYETIESTKLQEIGKRENIKTKSPFTLVGRMPGQSFSEKFSGDFTIEKNKNI